MAIEEVRWEWAITPDKRTGYTPIGEDNEKFRRAVLQRLEDTENYPNVEGVIFYQNEMLDSSCLGESSILCYGKGFTVDDIEALKADPMKFVIGDVPSRMKIPQWYISREAHLKEIGES